MEDDFLPMTPPIFHGDNSLVQKTHSTMGYNVN